VSHELRGQLAPPEIAVKVRELWRVADKLREADDVEPLEGILTVLLSEDAYKTANDRANALDAVIHKICEMINPRYAKAIRDISKRNVLGFTARQTDADLENGFLILDRESSKNRTAYKWPLVGELGELVCAQLERNALDERNLRRVIPWLFHRDGQPIPYETLRKVWLKATKAAGYPGKLMHDFRRTAATRLDSTPGIHFRLR
jgi:hypothetical protein